MRFLRSQLILTALVVLSVTGAKATTEPTPKSSDVVISSPTIWSLAGIEGDIHEIWSGPRDEKGAPPGEPQGIWKVSAYGQVFSSQGWTDLRQLQYSHAESRPGQLVLSSQDGLVRIVFSTRRSFAECPIFIRYEFAHPVDFRFRLQANEGSKLVALQNPAGLGVSSVQERGAPQLNVASNPAGVEIGAEGKNSVTREIRQAREIIVCLYLGKTENGATSGETAVQAWMRRAGGTEDTEGERLQDRLNIQTGVKDFDRMLEYSVDAVESARFQSGVLIAGRDGWYKNTWIRDGTYSTMGTDLFGLHAQADAFYRHWIENGGYSWGGEREAQQPAIGIVGMWFHSRLIEDDQAFLNFAYGYVSHFADYYVGRIRKEGMLGTAEEWICQVPTKTAWPNAEIHAGLRAAAKIARRLSRENDAVRWDTAADSLQKAILDTAYDKEHQRFIPLAGPAGKIYRDQQDPTNNETSGPMRDERVDSGMLMLARLEAFGRGLGAVAVDDPRFIKTQAWIQKVLEQPDHSISRFEGNPASKFYTHGQWPVWPLMSGVAADIELLQGRKDRAWQYLLSGLVRKQGYDAEASVYSLPEQWKFNGEAVSTRQLTWSHGELLTSSVLLLTGLQVDVPNADLAFAPSLPPESTKGSVTHFQFRGWNLDLNMERRASGLAVRIAAHRASPKTISNEVLRIGVPGKVLELHSGKTVDFVMSDSP
ncbi:MAG TPA: hypothetical protein VHD32_00845 [Candidatus Didemnitutus sp.]|nr:hypothetical protein [Candidatus Didemnitutus sp.]